MNILMVIIYTLIVFVLGIGAGGYIVYKYEEKTITELTKRCAEASKRLEAMIKDEERFVANMHEVPTDYLPMKGNLVDYLKAKYMGEEPSDRSDCEDESDNLYV